MIRGAAGAGDARTPDAGTALITGGAGFIGTNLARRLVREGHDVVVLDNLSRPGVAENLRGLLDAHGERVEAQIEDVRDRETVARLVAEADRVFHFAAQVAVTTSLRDPRSDFEVNARATLDLLEALRACEDPPPLVFTSTNKVYGDLSDLDLRRSDGRYEPRSRELREQGIGEDRPLDFHSPYGCSKGAADQYVLDYARSFGLPAVVFRMSCIYGPHQHGTEDQGWVAHFLIRAIRDDEISIYGDGRQVRDLLFVDDLVEALLEASHRARDIAGRAFNVGGGPENSVSLLELLDLIADLRGSRPSLRFEDWRRGDQRYYVSDTRRVRDALEWRPRTGVREGVRRLHDWLLERHGDDVGRVAAHAGETTAGGGREGGLAVRDRGLPSGAAGRAEGASAVDDGSDGDGAGDPGDASAPGVRLAVEGGNGTGPDAGTMRAAVLTSPGTFELREVPVPEPDDGEVRVAVEGCGVCGSDLPPWRGEAGVEYPRRAGAPGHEGWGRVDAVGDDVDGLRQGDRVAFLGSAAYADFAIAEAARTVPLPEDLGSAPFPAEPLACAVNVWQRSGVHERDTVAVVGVGFLGALLVEIAAGAGARVLALSRRETALRAAAEKGADETFSLEEDGAVEAALEATGGEGCDVVVEAAGVQRTLDVAARLTRVRGRLVIAGYHQDGPRRVDMQMWNWRGLDVVNAHERDADVYVDGMRRAARAVCRGALDPFPLFSHAFELEAVDQAFRVLDERPAGFMKALVLP